MSLIRLIGLTGIAVALAGCASQTGYRAAFSDKMMSGASRRIEAPFAPTYEVVKLTLVQRGFNLEDADSVGGLIKAARSFEDPRHHELSYVIHATVSVSGLGPSATVVAIAATQQTIRHSASHRWSSVLGMVPVPLPGKIDSAVVVKEGAIDDPRLYGDFFGALEQILIAPQPTPAARTTAPAAPRALPPRS